MSNRRRFLLVLGMLCIGRALAGCSLFFPVPATGAGCKGEAARFFPAADVVRIRAEDELSCPRASIRVVVRDDTTFGVTGCGKSDVYTCEADAVSGCDLEEAAERDSCERVED